MADTRPVAQWVPSARLSWPDIPTSGITRVDRTIPSVQHVYRLSNAWVRPEPGGTEMILAGSEIGSDLNGVVIVRHTRQDGLIRGPLIVLDARPGDGWLAVRRKAGGTLTLRASRGRTYCFDIAAETLARATTGPCPIDAAP